MLRVLAIVAIIATTSAYIPEYDEEAAYRFGIAHPETEMVNAILHNSEIEMKLRVDDDLSEFGVGLVPDPSPDQADVEEEGCQSLLGIHLESTGKDFCDLAFFLLSAYRANNPSEVEEHMQFALFFKNSHQPFLLETTIYKAPAELTDQTELQKWASDKKVGINAPIDALLNDVNDKNEWKGDWKWLSDLVSLGIFKSDRPFLSQGHYTTRPLIMSEAVIEKISQTVEKFRKNQKE